MHTLTTIIGLFAGILREIANRAETDGKPSRSQMISYPRCGVRSSACFVMRIHLRDPEICHSFYTLVIFSSFGIYIDNFVLGAETREIREPIP